MDGSVHISETRQGKILQRIAAAGERLAMLAAERAEAAESTEDFKAAVDAFVKLSRGVRMTLALENKLMRETAAHDRAQRAERELQTKEAVARRRQRLYGELHTEVLRDYEEPEFRDEVLADLQDRLNEEIQLETFLEEPYEQQVARIRRIFNLDGQDPDEDLPEDWDRDDESADPDDPEDSS